MTETAAPQPPAARRRFDPGFCPAHRRRLLLIAAILASALGFIDGTFVAIAMPAMRETLGASLSQAQWISNAYMLTLSALILVGGALGDRFGHARVFRSGIGLFVVTSVLCALAPSAETLIWARAAQGIGAAMMVPGSLALINRAYPKEERGKAIGIWAAASALTTAIGPVIGGLALSVGGPEVWRWLFGINLPLGLVALWLVARSVERDAGNPGQGLDVAGAGLATLGLGCIAWALTGAEHGGEGPAGALWIGLAGGAILVAFVFWERIATAPMMPPALFRNRTFAAANLSTLFLYFSLSAILFFLPMTAIAGWGISEAEVSVVFLPITGFITLLSPLSGRWADRFGPGVLIGSGSAIVAVAFAGLALTAGLQSFWGAVLPFMTLMGFGMALVVAPLSTAVMGAATDAQSGAASGVNNAVSRIAGLVAVAAMGTLAASVYAGAGGSESFGLPGADSDHVGATNAAFAAIAWTTAGLAALSAVVAFAGIARPGAASG